MDLAAIPPYGKIFLIVTWLETLLYGINVILFVACMWVLTSRKRSMSGLLCGSTLILFAMATAHVGLSLAQLIEAFGNEATLEETRGPDIYFIDEANPLYTAKNMIYCFVVLAQDLLLIWRLYMVWGRSWKICVLPCIIECGRTASILTSAIFEAMPGTELFSKKAQVTGLTGWGLDVLLNTGVTALIGWRLWRANSQVAATYHRRSSYITVMFIVLESGAVFASATIILFVCDLAGNVAGSVGINPVSQLAATVPLLIIVRVGLGNALRGNRDYDSHAVVSSVVTTAPSGVHRRIEVNVSQSADVARDSPFDASSPEKPPRSLKSLEGVL